MVSKTIGGAKNGGKREIEPKLPKYYPADDLPAKAIAKKSVQKPAKLKSSLTPGTVVILLSGRFRGKRAIFLKQLESGLILVTGPFKVNGVPLRRVNQAYTIATSTKVDVSKLKLTSFNDAYFAKPAAKKEKKSEADFFAQEEEKTEIKPERIQDQKAMDAQLEPIIAKTPMLKEYLTAKFSLKKGQYPHEMKF